MLLNILNFSTRGCGLSDLVPMRWNEKWVNQQIWYWCKECKTWMATWDRHQKSSNKPLSQVAIQFMSNWKSFPTTTHFLQIKKKYKKAPFINKNIQGCRGTSARRSKWHKANSFLLWRSIIFSIWAVGTRWALSGEPELHCDGRWGVEFDLCLVWTGTKIQISAV